MYPPETDPASLLKAYYTALNSGNVDAAVELFADDGVRADITPPDLPIVVNGKERIRMGIKARVTDNAYIEARNFEVVGNKVRCVAQFSTDFWRKQGLDPMEETVEVTVENGRIIFFQVCLTPATVDKVQAASQKTTAVS